jgi:hypothetical protein
MFNLTNLFKKEKYVCNHRFPDVALIADLIDREGKEIRAYFCYKCHDYRYKEVINSKDDPHFFDIIQKNKYQIYCNLNALFSKTSLF